jgi:hypothetical protein
MVPPSFGPVHTRPDDGRTCRCGKRHDAGDPELGSAIDPTTNDYEGAVLWNWHAPALWNRFVIELVRVLAAHVGLNEREWRQASAWRMRKVAELQARGLVHFHVAVRLDGAEDRAMAPGVAVSPEELCAAIREAAGRVRLDGDAGHGETVELRFGEQLHTRVRAGADDGGELCAGKVAAYVAKYSCKSSHEQITSRDAKPDSWRKKGVPEHLIEMAGAALRLSELRAAPDRQVDAHAGLPRALRHQGRAATPRRSASCAPPGPRIGLAERAGRRARGRLDPRPGCLGVRGQRLPQPRRRALGGGCRSLATSRPRSAA